MREIGEKQRKRERDLDLKCALCGGGVAPGDYYYRLEGRAVCEACLERFARAHFAGERLRAGRGAAGLDPV